MKLTNEMGFFSEHGKNAIKPFSVQLTELLNCATDEQSLRALECMLKRQVAEQAFDRYQQLRAK